MLTTRRLQALLYGRSAKLAVYTLAGVFVFLLVFLIIDLPHGPEHWSADLRTAYLSRQLDKQHDRIAIVEISDSTLDKYPYVSPTDRELLADLVRIIDGAGPRAIGLDFILDRYTEPIKDAKLIETIRVAQTPIVLGALDDDLQPQSRRMSQSDFLNRAQRPVGHLYLGHERDNPLVISEHVIRKIAEPSRTQGNRLSFAEVIAGLDGSHHVDEGRQIAWLIPPANGAETFLTLPAEQVLAQDMVPIKELLRGRFVLIGGNFSDRDQHLTPLSVVTEQRFSGLFIHAQILAQLLADEHIYTFESPYLFAVLLFVVGVLGFLTGRSHRAVHNQLVIELLGAIAFIVISVVTFRYARFIFPFVSVLVTWLAGLSGGHYSRYARRWILTSAK
jgi:adenylate cyclase